MSYTINTTFTQEEHKELWAVLGEFRRVCRDQVTRWVGTSYQTTQSGVSIRRLELAESLIKKLVNEESVN